MATQAILSAHWYCRRSCYYQRTSGFLVSSETDQKAILFKVDAACILFRKYVSGPCRKRVYSPIQHQARHQKAAEASDVGTMKKRRTINGSG